jgi:transcriptional regulator with XRE-family HTH domain
MIVTQQPVIQRRLATTLRKIRVKLDRTQEDVASALAWSTAKLMRIEQGTVRISMTDLKALLGHYGVDDQQRVDELAEMARELGRRSWSPYQGFLLPDYLRYLSYESAARRVCNWQPLLLPGLLQTESYARATMLGMSSGEDLDTPTIDRLVEARLHRQELLDSPTAPEMVFLLDEGVISRPVGDRHARAHQLERLRQAAGNPKVQIRVVPADAGAHEGLVGSFVVLEFPDESEDLVYLEDARADLLPRDWHQDVAGYKARFARLERLALPAEQLGEVIDRVLAQLAGDR